MIQYKQTNVEWFEDILKSLQRIAMPYECVVWSYSAPLLDGRRGSDMDLWRSSEPSSGVYLSPANAPEFPDLDSSECWSDSEFEDDLDDDETFETKGDQDCVSQSSSYTSGSEVGHCLFHI